MKMETTDTPIQATDITIISTAPSTLVVLVELTIFYNYNLKLAW